MILLDGKKLSGEILDNLKKEIKTRRLKLRLAVVLVGENLASEVFVREKEKACKTVGIDFKLYQFRENGSREILLEEIKKIIKNEGSSGVVIQLPLPGELKPEEFLNLIPEENDIDVLSEKSFQRFSNGDLPILPPTVGAVAAILDNYKIKINGKNIVIVGKGRLVGKPLAAWLKLQKAKFSVLDKNTKNISAYARKADILISGVGEAGLIKSDMVKEGAVVIDAGSVKKDGKIVGDVDFKSVSKKASYITPVPGGVGPLTVACLLENLTICAKKSYDKHGYGKTFFN